MSQAAERSTGTASRRAQSFLRKAGKVGKVIVPILFIHDWYEGGFWHATKNTANDLAWPVSELWN